MRYTSTRDASISCSFEEAICSGYAPGGGLFVPCTLPKIDSKLLQSWSCLSYSQLASSVIRMFISPDEISDGDLQEICDKSFIDGFESKDKISPVPVFRLGNGFVTELFHGPTFCFKDFGMRALVNMLSHFSSKRKQKITLIVSTTGDTGPAAVQAVSDASNPLLTLLVHFPFGQISALQRKQLTTVNSPYVIVASFDGGGDDMDLPIKRILSSSKTERGEFQDENGEMEEKTRLLCGVNSYNIGRPLIQMIHFIWTYLRVVEQLGVQPGDKSIPVDIILPTGAMGNIAGGYMAKKMGIPIGTLCAGVNINDITHRAIQHGKFYKSLSMEKTMSEAINIQVPYNFERLLFYLTDEDHALVNNWMGIMDSTEKLDLDDLLHEKIQTDFKSARITDDEMFATMKSVKKDFNYLMDPHTAVAAAAAEKNGYNLSDKNEKDKNILARPFAILSTASPCKFEESVTMGIGEENWQQYYYSDFPERAKSILTKAEVPPVTYSWVDGGSLCDAQKQWERQAREIIEHKFL